MNSAERKLDQKPLIDYAIPVSWLFYKCDLTPESCPNSPTPRSTEDWTQGMGHVGQALLPVSYGSSSSPCWIFKIGLFFFLFLSRFFLSDGYFNPFVHTFSKTLIDRLHFTSPVLWLNKISHSGLDSSPAWHCLVVSTTSSVVLMAFRDSVQRLIFTLGTPVRWR